MARRYTMLTLALWLALGQPADALQDDRLNTLVDDVETGLDDIVHIWTAPFRADGDDVPRVLGVLGVTAAAAAFDAEIQHWIRSNPDALPIRWLEPFRENAPLSDLGRTYTLLPLSAVAYTTGLILGSEALRDAGLGCAVSDIANTVARHTLARLIGRLRPESRRGPFVIRPFRFGEWEWRSFPGGHAANIMACTGFVTGRFELGLLEPALFGLAALVGGARVIDEAHWASDTVFGFIFGWAVGDEVADRFLARRAEGADAADAADTAVPTDRPASAPAVRIRVRIRLP